MKLCVRGLQGVGSTSWCVGQPRVRRKKLFGNRLMIRWSKIDFKWWRLFWKWPQKCFLIRNQIRRRWCALGMGCFIMRPSISYPKPNMILIRMAKMIFGKFKELEKSWWYSGDLYHRQYFTCFKLTALFRRWNPTGSANGNKMKLQLKFSHGSLSMLFH